MKIDVKFDKLKADKVILNGRDLETLSLIPEDQYAQTLKLEGDLKRVFNDGVDSEFVVKQSPTSGNFRQVRIMSRNIIDIVEVDVDGNGYVILDELNSYTNFNDLMLKTRNDNVYETVTSYVDVNSSSVTNNTSTINKYKVSQTSDSSDIPTFTITETTTNINTLPYSIEDVIKFGDIPQLIADDVILTNGVDYSYVSSELVTRPEKLFDVSLWGSTYSGDWTLMTTDGPTGPFGKFTFDVNEPCDIWLYIHRNANISDELRSFKFINEDDNIETDFMFGKMGASANVASVEKAGRYSIQFSQPGYNSIQLTGMVLVKKQTTYPSTQSDVIPSQIDNGDGTYTYETDVIVNDTESIDVVSTDVGDISIYYEHEIQASGVCKALASKNNIDVFVYENNIKIIDKSINVNVTINTTQYDINYVQIDNTGVIFVQDTNDMIYKIDSGELVEFVQPNTPTFNFNSLNQIVTHENVYNQDGIIVDTTANMYSTRFAKHIYETSRPYKVSNSYFGVKGLDYTFTVNELLQPSGTSGTVIALYDDNGTSYTSNGTYDIDSGEIRFYNIYGGTLDIEANYVPVDESIFVNDKLHFLTHTMLKDENGLTVVDIGGTNSIKDIVHINGNYYYTVYDNTNMKLYKYGSTEFYTLPDSYKKIVQSDDTLFIIMDNGSIQQSVINYEFKDIECDTNIIKIKTDTPISLEVDLWVEEI